MALTESRIRWIIREELESQVNEMTGPGAANGGFFSNLAAGAAGAVQGAVQGAAQGGLTGAVQGATRGAQQSVAANQRLGQAATALRAAAAVGGGGTLMARWDRNALMVYLMDWGGQPDSPNCVGRALWAALRLMSIERKILENSLYPAVLGALEKNQAMNSFGEALVQSSGINPGDPRWGQVVADAIVRNRIV